MKPLPATARALLIALLGAAIVLALQAWPGAGEALQYETARNAAEPWRLLTAHLVHVNWRHALVNAAAWIALARLFAPDLSAARQLAVLTAGAIGISTGLALFYPGITWYRGLSGALHALYFAGASIWLARAGRTRAVGASAPAALLAAGWLKVALELPRGEATPFAPWLGITTVPQAHLVGAIAGSALALAFVAFDARRARLSRRGAS